MLIRGANAIAKGLKTGNVYVHCQFGVSRSTSLILAFFLIHLKKTYSFSHNFVREKRPVIYPDQKFLNELKAIDLNLNKV